MDTLFQHHLVQLIWICKNGDPSASGPGDEIEISTEPIRLKTSSTEVQLSEDTLEGFEALQHELGTSLHSGQIKNLKKLYFSSPKKVIYCIKVK